MSGKALEDAETKLKQDFYKLHYPTKKKKQSVQKAKTKMRSKSVVTVLESSVSDQLPKYDSINPKGSIRKELINRSQIDEMRWSPDKKLYRSDEYRKKTFREILSPQLFDNKNIVQQIGNLQISSIKDIEDLSKNNRNIKQILHKSKDEKIKLNRIVLSHKQSQQIKVQYLQSKQEEVQVATQAEMRNIYDNFFKKEYETFYGQYAYQKFQQKMGVLLNALDKKIFMH